MSINTLDKMDNLNQMINTLNYLEKKTSKDFRTRIGFLEDPNGLLSVYGVVNHKTAYFTVYDDNDYMGTTSSDELNHRDDFKFDEDCFLNMINLIDDVSIHGE